MKNLIKKAILSLLIPLNIVINNNAISQKTLPTPQVSLTIINQTDHDFDIAFDNTQESLTSGSKTAFTVPLKISSGKAYDTWSKKITITDLDTNKQYPFEINIYKDLISIVANFYLKDFQLQKSIKEKEIVKETAPSQQDTYAVQLILKGKDWTSTELNVENWLTPISQ